jgi:ATP-dependent Lhr-like helicase
MEVGRKVRGIFADGSSALKKLVADILDRIELHETFDPRKDYRLTIRQDELSTEERNLMPASSVVEPVLPPKHPLHLFAQQLMALALQEQGIGVQDWRRWIARLPAFSQISDSDVDDVIGHLLEQTILFSDGTRLSFGDEGAALYGRRHFLELVSVFTSPPLFTVLHGRKELGTVHQIAFLRHRPDEPTILSLGGRSWAVTSLEWPKRIAYVIPADEKGKSQWLSTQFGLSFKLCRGVHDLLTEDAVSDRWSSRAQERISSLRKEHSFLDRTTDAVLVAPGLNEIRWFTFAGNIVNLAIADSIRQRGYDDVRTSDFWIRINGTTDHEALFNEINRFNFESLRSAFRIPEEYLNQLKFSECLPQPYAKEIVKDRLLQRAYLARDHADGKEEDLRMLSNVEMFRLAQPSSSRIKRSSS